MSKRAGVARLHLHFPQRTRVDRVRHGISKGQLSRSGGGDLQDEVYAAKLLRATGYIDSNKIGITGGSYGGFMTLMAIGKTPDVWAASVELYGIINWMSMLEHSDPQLQQCLRSLLGDPVKNKSVYQATSPLAYIHNVKAPLLVLQGDNDPRVPKEEAASSGRHAHQGRQDGRGALLPG